MRSLGGYSAGFYSRNLGGDGFSGKKLETIFMATLSTGFSSVLGGGEELNGLYVLTLFPKLLFI